MRYENLTGKKNMQFWPQLFLDLCFGDTMADTKSLPTEWLAMLNSDAERQAAKEILEDYRPVEAYIYLQSHQYIYIIYFRYMYIWNILYI